MHPNQIPVSSSVIGFQIEMVEPAESENTKTVHSVYEGTVYIDSAGNMGSLKIRLLPAFQQNQTINQKSLKGMVQLIPSMKLMSF